MNTEANRTTPNIITDVLEIVKAKYIAKKGKIYPNDLSKIRVHQLSPNLCKQEIIYECIKESIEDLNNLLGELKQNIDIQKKIL